MIVYLLTKHPSHPYSRNVHMKAGEVIGVYANRDEPDRIAKEKNDRKPLYLWLVQRKKVKQ